MGFILISSIIGCLYPCFIPRILRQKCQLKWLKPNKALKRLVWLFQIDSKPVDLCSFELKSGRDKMVTSNTRMSSCLKQCLPLAVDVDVVDVDIDVDVAVVVVVAAEKSNS